MTNLATIVRDARADHSGRTAVRAGDHVLTYAELDRLAGQLVAELPKGPTGKILRREVQPPAGEPA